MNKRGSSRELQDTIVIVPAYNEGKVVRGNLEKIFAIFPRVVCVNDGSVDDTLECARQSGAIVIDHPINIGQGGAIQTGIDYGLQEGYQYFATIDADGQHSFTDLRDMLIELKKGDTDIVLGSRFLGRKAENMPRAKRLLLRLAVLFSNVTSGSS